MIKNRLREVPGLFENTGRLLWRRLPRIALYAVAIYCLVSVADRAFYKVMAANHFVHYTSFIVQNAFEGEDVTYTVCRDHRGDFRLNNERAIYIVPEGKTADSKVFVHSQAFDSVVSGANCQSYIISNQEYHHQPGSYTITLFVNFKTKYGYDKHTTIRSNIYRVRPTSAGADVQILINNLQAQIDMLRGRLGLPPVSGAQSAPARQATPQTQGAVPGAQGAQGVPGEQGQAGTSPSTVPEPEPVRVLGVPVCVPLTGVCVRQ